MSVSCVCASFVRASICPFQLVTGVVLLAFLLFRSLYIQCIDCALYSFLAVVFLSSSFLYSPSLRLLPFLLPIHPSYSVPLIFGDLNSLSFSLTSLCLCAVLFFFVEQVLSVFPRYHSLAFFFFSIYTLEQIKFARCISFLFFPTSYEYSQRVTAAPRQDQRETLTHLPFSTTFMISTKQKF